MNKKKISKIHKMLLKKIRRENLIHAKEMSSQRSSPEGEENCKIKPQIEVNILVHLKIGITTLNQKVKN